jgi:hypothetical protein
MTLVVDKFRTLIPPRAKASPSGWTSFNAPCCHHRGHSQDTRKRGGLRFDNGVSYNCFNCKFTANWQPGRALTEKFKSLCKWMGANDDDINTMIFEALKTESPEYEHKLEDAKVMFESKELPEGAMPLLDWVNSVYWKDIALEVEPVIAYVVSRGYDPFDGNYYWSPADGYTNRVIIPFKWEGRIVGNTARKVTAGKPKYLSDQHPHFVFNVDAQQDENRYIFVCEGPFDALSIGGVALLTNDVADQQARIINGLGKQVIVIPDQDSAGLNLVKRAIDYGWAVAFPTWDDTVKDCADAVSKYGKLFVIVDAIKTAQQGEIKITMARKALETKIKRIEHVEGNN